MTAREAAQPAPDMAEAPCRWAVVGGGMLGLTLALRLHQAGQRVTVFEAAPSFGGLASAWRVGDVVWDRYYHVIMQTDARLRSLLTELGLERDIRWEVTRTNFYTGRSMHPLNNVFDYLRLPTLGPLDKARLAATILYASRIEDGRPLEKLSAAAWLTRLSGEATYRNLWQPLLRSKLGSNESKASAAYIWSVIRRFYGARQGGMQKEMFGYVPGGYGRILEALLQRLEAAGVTLQVNAPVTSVGPVPGGLTVKTGEGVQRFDRVVNTCAAPIALQACEGLSADERARHAAIKYQGIVCASLLLTRPLGGAYLTYITDESIPFTTVIEMTSLVDRALTGGKHLVYLPRYLPADDPLLDVADDEIEARFLPALMRMFPDLKRDEITAFKVTRTRHVLALSTLDYSDRLPPMATALPGLFIVNSAQIVNASLSVNETVNLANEAAAMLLSQPAVAGAAAR
ncbi:NAD(P)/FAD-dependent oxidoreductase [Pelagibius sp. 7325]|uniref:NAD(P)/FAD-dependent oxidoreductase n=1 Tax=Pelagibius sp. 7325 TaxID=3131994 RepID=UPI0030EBEEB0